MAECFKVVVLHIEILYAHMQISESWAMCFCTCNREWALVCCITWQKQSFMQGQVTGTTVMLGYMIALTSVTRSLGCFPASKSDTLLEMALHYLQIYVTWKIWHTEVESLQCSIALQILVRIEEKLLMKSKQYSSYHLVGLYRPYFHN